MQLKTSDFLKTGHSEQIKKLVLKMRENHKEEVSKLARKWMEILGITVNNSFYDSFNKDTYTEDDIVTALYDLGVNYLYMPGKKWYQFWKKNRYVKIINAIKSIK